MKLLELALHRLPGIDRPFRLGAGQLGDGVHVVYGPNGIGKSSLLRALRALWWPQTVEPQGVAVEARFEHAGHVWHAERDGAGVRWRRDGARCDAPELPDEHLSSACLVGLDDLASAGDAGWFTARVGIAFTGDFDLRGARDRLFAQRAQAGQREARAWDDARARRAEREREQRALLDEERELEELDTRLEHATQAQSELARLELARQLEGLRAQRHGLALRLQAWPAGIARLPQEAAETLERLDRDWNKLRQVSASRERERAELERARARSRLTAPLSAPELEEARGRLDELRRLEGELASAAVRLAELEARAAVAGSAGATNAAADAERQRRAANALRAWLSTSEPAPAPASSWILPVAAAAGAVVLGLRVHPAGYALLIVVAIDLALRVRRARPSSARAQWRAQFELASLAGPARWDDAGVRLRLEELDRGALELERRARESEVDLAGERARRTELETRRDEIADALGAWLAERGAEGGADAPALARALATLEARSRELAQALESARLIERELGERAREIEALERTRAALFERVGLRPEQRAEFDHLVESRPEWERATRRREALDEEIEGLTARLAAAGGPPETAAEDLDERIARSRDAAAQYRELLTRSTAIRTRIESASAGLALEEARAQEAETRHELERAWSETRFALLGRMLVEDVERDHAVSTRPALLEAARAHFARFTHGRYLLDVRDRDGGWQLVAEDSARPGAALDVGELSDGTRAQLLLAVRMAHLAHVEGPAALPLFLDDALATSDAERTLCVAEALFELAAQGRQVFVLLRDLGDARLIAGCGAGARLIDLAAVRGEQVRVRERERLAPPRRREVPAPAGFEPLDWALALGVTPPDPWRGAEDAHLFWILFEERELLHELLTWGIDDLGRLRALVEVGAAGFMAPQALARVESQARLFEAVRRGWLVGRGRRLSRAVLEDADGITPTFLERLDELSADLGRDAKRLVAALEAREDPRAKGFRAASLAALRESLERSGHLDAREVLDTRAAWDRLLSDLPDAAERDPLELRRSFEFLRARFDEAAGA